MLFMSVTTWKVFTNTESRKICKVRKHRHKLDGLAESERMQKHN